MFEQLFSDIAGLWAKYGSVYLTGIANTLILAVTATLIGCIIGFFCGILQTIPISANDNILKRILLRLIRMIIRCLSHIRRISINALKLICSRLRERYRFKAALVLCLLRQQLFENAVVIIREHSHGPEVPGQRQDRAAACLEQLLYFKKRRHIRAAEAVDRLLGITDDKERTLSRNAGAPLRNGVFR